MKTYKQWCEQTGKDDLANDLALATQNALKQGTNPEADAKKILAQKSIAAQSTGDSDAAAKVANAATKFNQNANGKKMKKK
ncbi:MAG: hypothetical protein M0R80_02000 [Proteobacteria bacterium]|jgi:hypothetical protein|nr:hypothetical protein [Pseudomonadota bacterium]